LFFCLQLLNWLRWWKPRTRWVCMAIYTRFTLFFSVLSLSCGTSHQFCVFFSFSIFRFGRWLTRAPGSTPALACSNQVSF
jgi:hypothetical protein